jgi:N-acetyl-anhydromuramyl-L-alanine amidase AmpD
MAYFSTPPLRIVDRRADDLHLGPIRRASDITLIILHATVGGLESSLDWLTVNPNSRVSVHRLIYSDGTIYKIAPDTRACNHVGNSKMGRTLNLNPMSLGIELVNRNDRIDAFDPLQVEACALQVREWWGLYGALPILTHAQVDTKGKTDPRGFPMAAFYTRLFARLRDVL